jgi:hypothetical protein
VVVTRRRTVRYGRAIDTLTGFTVSTPLYATMPPAIRALPPVVHV